LGQGKDSFLVPFIVVPEETLAKMPPSQKVLYPPRVRAPHPCLSQNNSHGGGQSLEGVAPLHWRIPQEWESEKEDCRAQGRGWGWKAGRLPEAPLLEVSYGRPGAKEGKWLYVRQGLPPPPASPQPHHPIVPAGWDGQRLGSFHFQGKGGIGRWGSPRRSPRSWAQVLWGAAKMRQRQIQLHDI
jgi:hypothetical protein